MIISTLDTLPGKNIIEYYGTVVGTAVETRNIFIDWLALIRSIIGGEIKDYTALMEKATAKALDRLSTQAKEAGANAIIGVHFSTSYITAASSEIIIYGTAIKYDNK